MASPVTCMVFQLVLVLPLAWSQNSTETTKSGDGTANPQTNATGNNEGLFSPTFIPLDWTADIMMTTASEDNGTNTSTTALPIAEWQWDPLTWSWWILPQLISSILGIVGNVLVLAVLFLGRGAGSSADAFIANLAVADLFTSVFLFPLPRATKVPSTFLGELYCRIIFTSVLMWLCIFTSTLTLMAISIERTLAIVYPLRFVRFKNRRRVNICILLLWAMSFGAHIFITITIHVHGASMMCKVRFQNFSSQLTVGIVTFLICFLIPTSVMVITQSIAARVLQKQYKSFNCALTGDRSNKSINLLVAKKRVLNMLCIVVTLFIFCWGPNSVAYFLYNLRVLDSSYLYGPIDRILVTLAFFNSCANPIVYTIRYPRFRKAIRGLLTCSQRREKALFEFNPASVHSNMSGQSNKAMSSLQ